jgi:hypothetical protein
MLTWLRKTWGEARSSVLREEFDQSLAHVAAFDTEQRLQCYRTVAGALHRLVERVGPIEHLNNPVKKQLSTMLSETARELFPSKPAEAYGTAFLSMWLESQTLIGDDADYVRVHSREFIDTTLQGYETERLSP